jgi:hypothetical protein
MNNDPEYFDPKLLKFNYDLSKCNFQLDILQDKLLQFYLRSDKKFRKAFMTNYTNEFFQFLKDKARLNESFHVSTMGLVRSSKSTSMITICVFHQAIYHKKFSVDYVCGNQYEYIEKLQTFSENKLYNRIFLLDEEKQNTMGVGSVARKLKLQDVNNIIAKNNISTISINPQNWANPFSFYGMRAFGKCMDMGINRFMLYNLQSSQSTASPMGLIYIPMFQKIIPQDYAEELNKKYLEKKDKWIEAEMRGESDVFAEIRKTKAKEFLKDKQFLSLKKKAEKFTYLVTKLGSEWTKGECEEVFNLTKLFEQGIDFD